MIQNNLRLCAIILFSIAWHICYGQQTNDDNKTQDSNYVADYSNRVIVRTYLSNKFLMLGIQPKSKNQPNLLFRPNTPVTLGAGITYKMATLNIAVGFGFINNGRIDRGKPKYLDMQMHMYGPKATIDLYNQFYKNFYTKNTSSNATPFNTRPDLGMIALGGQYEYKLNWRKLSFAAAAIQNKRQLKSAGSVLIGAAAQYFQYKADSSIYPNAATQNKVHFKTLNIAPLLGYSYNLVLLKHFFINPALNLQPGLSFNTLLEQNKPHNRITFSPQYHARIAIGFANNNWTITAFGSMQHLGTKDYMYTYQIRSGIARFMVAYRLKQGASLQKKLHFLDAKDKS